MPRENPRRDLTPVLTPARASSDDQPIIPPPSTVTVDHQRKPVLFTHDGTALVRKIGY